MALHSTRKAQAKSRNSGKPQARRSSDKPRAAAEAVADRSAAVAKSWKNKEVAAARATKDKVKVGGTVYSSLRKAFEALGLPMGKHNSFRLELKAARRKIFTAEDGAKHHFSIADAA